MTWSDLCWLDLRIEPCSGASMRAEAFLDVNVLLYASSNAAEDKAKRECA